MPLLIIIDHVVHFVRLRWVASLNYSATRGLPYFFSPLSYMSSLRARSKLFSPLKLEDLLQWIFIKEKGMDGLEWESEWGTASLSLFISIHSKTDICFDFYALICHWKPFNHPISRPNWLMNYRGGRREKRKRGEHLCQPQLHHHRQQEIIITESNVRWTSGWRSRQVDLITTITNTTISSGEDHRNLSLRDKNHFCICCPPPWSFQRLISIKQTMMMAAVQPTSFPGSFVYSILVKLSWFSDEESQLTNNTLNKRRSKGGRPLKWTKSIQWLMFWVVYNNVKHVLPPPSYRKTSAIPTM